MFPTRVPRRDFRQTNESMPCSAAFGRSLAPVLLCWMIAAPAVSQAAGGADPWTQEELRARASGFLEVGVLAQARQIAALVRNAELCADALAQTVHGDHREYSLKIERLLDQLADERWVVRENAERRLVEDGARAQAQIEERAQSGETLEERIRARRIANAIADSKIDDARNEIRILRGLVATAAYMPGNDRLRRALISALGHTDPLVVEHALVALGATGSHAEDATLLRTRVLEEASGSAKRRAALAGLALLQVPEARDVVLELFATDGVLTTTEASALLADLRAREDGPEVAARISEVAVDPAIRSLAGLSIPVVDPDERVTARTQLADRGEVDAPILEIRGSWLVFAELVDGLDRMRLPRLECPVVLRDVATAPLPEGAVRVFTKQGSLVVGRLLAADAETITVRSELFGEVSIRRDQVQGVATDPELDRLVGAVPTHDRIRMRDNKMIDARILSFADGTLVYEPAAGGEAQEVALTDVAGLLFRRPQDAGSSNALFARLDLASGDRLLAHLGGHAQGRLAAQVPGLGAAVVEVADVQRIEFGVGGGALWGFTLIADYSDNRIFEVDDQGRETFALEEVYGAWDVECLDSGNLLITEFALNRVVEVTRDGEEVWSFEELRNPYDADRLPNGNTLIADTFGKRVVEVSPDKQIVWTFEGVKPYDVDRLPNGNVLIADGEGSRVIEVSRDGEVVWEMDRVESAHDADRLPNGNTLITQRTKHQVIEVDRSGKIVFQITDLSSPSDADRLPNGHTLVAENGGVREFDRNGNQVAEIPAAWAVEVNRY